MAMSRIVVLCSHVCSQAWNMRNIQLVNVSVGFPGHCASKHVSSSKRYSFSGLRALAAHSNAPVGTAAPVALCRCLPRSLVYMMSAHLQRENTARWTLLESSLRTTRAGLQSTTNFCLPNSRDGWGESIATEVAQALLMSDPSDVFAGISPRSNH